MVPPPPCYSCGRPGAVRWRTKTPSGRLRLILKCFNPACRFEFINADRQRAFAQPKWSHVPNPAPAEKGGAP